MRVLLTGGCGFIGSNLLPALLELPHVDHVVVLDNLATGKMQNIAAVQDSSKVTFVNGDIRDHKLCLEVCDGIDLISHQAALGSVPRSITDPVTTNEVNVSGFVNMLDAARTHKVKRFVFAASSSTYGDSASLPKQEDIIGRPLSPYAVTKYVNELYADVFGRTYGLPWIGLRYFNVFGPKQDPNSYYSAVIPLFCKAILEGKEIPINGDGSVSRDFTYIDNVVRANLLALFNDNAASLNNVYNVACGNSYTVRYLAEKLIEISGRQVSIHYGPPRKGDIQHSMADISKARKLLGYEPALQFEHGLVPTWEYYASIL